MVRKRLRTTVLDSINVNKKKFYLSGLKESYASQLYFQHLNVHGQMWS